MPHDKNGALLKTGDVVNIEAKVVSISENTDLCNCTLVTVEPFYPQTTGTTIVVNTKQVTKITE